MNRATVIGFWVGISGLVAATILAVVGGQMWLSALDGVLIGVLVFSWLLNRRRYRKARRELLRLMGNGAGS